MAWSNGGCDLTGVKVLYMCIQMYVATKIVRFSRLVVSLCEWSTKRSRPRLVRGSSLGCLPQPIKKWKGEVQHKFFALQQLHLILTMVKDIYKGSVICHTITIKILKDTVKFIFK